MGQITLSIKDETIAALRKEFDAFARVSAGLDPQFTAPSFEAFLRAKLLDSVLPLTEQAVQHLLQTGQYAWAKRTLEKEFPDLVGILVEQAKEFGFGFAGRSEWTPDELKTHSHDWAAAIVKEAQGGIAQIGTLAHQIEEAAIAHNASEESAKTAAWRISESLRQRIYEAKSACEQGVGSSAREKLGELRGLLRFAFTHEAISKEEAQQMMEYLRILKPEIFVEEPYDVFTRMAAWLRAIFLPQSPTQRKS